VPHWYFWEKDRRDMNISQGSLTQQWTKLLQILKDSKMASISIQNTLANRTTVPPEHFSPICSATLVFGTPFYCLGGDIYEFVT
jgi:hypothetical protein